MGKRLYVRNLGPLVDASELESMFTTVGNVESVDVVLDSKTGVSSGFGYVVMSTEQEALDCIDRFHGCEGLGTRIVVTKDEPHIPSARPLKRKAR